MICNALAKRCTSIADKVSDPVIVGDEVSCTIEVKKNKKGGNYNLLTLKKTQQTVAQTPATPPPPQTPPIRPAINVGVGKSKEELKVDATLCVAEVLIKGFCEGKLESAQVSVNVKEFSRLLWSEIEEIYGAK